MPIRGATQTDNKSEELKNRVRTHWEQETAGTRYADENEDAAYYAAIEKSRYELEPFILELAGFEQAAGERVLEIGVGAGTDFSQFVRHGARAVGVDLTMAAVQHTARHLKALNISSGNHDLLLADAENLPFVPDSFDRVYSWGVLHHTPDTVAAFRQVARVLKPGGTLTVMLYRVPSWTALLLWLQHGLLKGKPWRSARWCVAKGLESPGTKVYTSGEVRAMLAGIGFEGLRIVAKLGPADLLLIKPSERYRGVKFRLMWLLYPRWLVRLLGHRLGFEMVISGVKSQSSRAAKET